jgi:hypothetical protein
MKVTLKIWRQKDAKSKGEFKTYYFDGASPEMSFLEIRSLLMKGKILLHLIMIAVKVSVVHAECILMVNHMGP